MRYRWGVWGIAALFSTNALACDLFSAIIDGDAVAVDRCIQAGGEVNKHSAMAGASPLIIAVNHSDRISPRIVAALIKAGADVNYSDDYGTVPLTQAAKKGYMAVVQLLVEGGADIDIKGQDGHTPLMEAAMSDQLEVVQFLIAQGADIHLQDASGQDALARARGWKRERVVRYLESLSPAPGPQ